MGGKESQGKIDNKISNLNVLIHPTLSSRQLSKAFAIISAPLYAFMLNHFAIHILLSLD